MPYASEKATGNNERIMKWGMQRVRKSNHCCPNFLIMISGLHVTRGMAEGNGGWG
jgi:hypothetical protein